MVDKMFEKGKSRSVLKSSNSTTVFSFEGGKDARKCNSRSDWMKGSGSKAQTERALL